MIRKATIEDLEQIENSYEEHFQYEKEHEVFTVFRKGIYPTGKDAKAAIDNHALYIFEENGVLTGSIIADQIQSEEYRNIQWMCNVPDEKVLVIHLLMVRPCMTGKGIASKLVNYVIELAEKAGCKSVRLDTGSQNSPAVALYKKNGFRIVEEADMKVGGAIAHKKHLFLERAV